MRCLSNAAHLGASSNEQHQHGRFHLLQLRLHSLSSTLKLPAWWLMKLLSELHAELS